MLRKIMIQAGLELAVRAGQQEYQNLNNENGSIVLPPDTARIKKRRKKAAAIRMDIRMIGSTKTMNALYLLISWAAWIPLTNKYSIAIKEITMPAKGMNWNSEAPWI